MHVHVHAAQHVAVAYHLQVVDDGVVTYLLGDQLLGPKREREGAHGGDAETALARCLRQRGTVMLQMRARLVHAGAGRRRHLDLRLQHFCHDAVAKLLLGDFEEFFVSAAHGPARLGVEHEILFFHADRIHARNNSSGRDRVPALSQCKTAAKRVGGRFKI